jgi:hypothetical protein
MEIRPAEAMASLSGINQELFSTFNSIVPNIRNSVTAFVGDTELQGRAFDNLKDHMSSEIDSGLLNRIVTAATALSAANTRHISALHGIAQYSVINSDQLRDDFARVHENLSFANSNLFPGVGDWIGLLNAELIYLRQKSEDFGQYLRASSGLYDNLFAELENDVLRKSFATFCNISGFVSVPTTSAMIYLKELTELDEYGNPVLDEDGNLVFVNWDMIDEILNKNIDDVSDAQWVALATVMTFMNCSELTEFYNRILVQGDDITVHLWGVGPVTQDIEIWQLDMEIMERLLWGMGVLANEIMAQEAALPCLRFPHNFRPDEWERYRARYGSLVDDLESRFNNTIQHLGMIAFMYSMQLDAGMIFTMDPHTEGPLLSISEITESGNRIGFTFNFIGGSYPSSRDLPGPVYGYGGLFGEQEFRISIPQAGREKNSFLADVFFDASGNVISDGMNATIAYIISAAIAYANKGASFMLSILGAIVAGERERINHQVMVNSSMALALYMHSIYITNHRGIVQDIIIPSYRTQGRLDYLNGRLGDAGHLGSVVVIDSETSIWVPKDGITMEDIYNRPEEIYELVSRYL